MEENLTVLEQKLSLPDNKYECVLYLEQLKGQLEQALELIGTKLESTYVDIKDSEDENYKCETVFATRKSSSLDYAMFESDLPEIYKRSLNIKASDAEKLLGKERLRQIVIDEVGWDNFAEIADVTITEARKNIPKALQSKYINEYYQPVGYKVFKK